MPISEETTQGGKGLEVPGAGAGLGTVPAPSRQNVEPRNPRCSGQGTQKGNNKAQTEQCSGLSKS